MIRHPAVAGQFYSASAQKLAAEVARFTDATATRQPAIAVIAPHAGLMYSGPVAGAVFAQVAVPPTVILIGPNHTGLGPPISVYAEGTWLLPGGAVSIDASLTQDILAAYSPAEADTAAHRFEHCLEVEVPFLQHARPDVRLVPIVLGTTSQQICRELGACLARVVQAHTHGAEQPLLVASTDMNHYESDQVTRQKDHLAIQA
ncbi:MAG: AmmeMemoRadiSam system protein B, partial [Deinococcus sp.]|nr:AmmeMemoRadiSam system protein B [Deinococcus sp.]